MTTDLARIMRLRQIRNSAEGIRNESSGGRISDLAELVSELADALLDIVDDEPERPPRGANPEPEDRAHGVNVFVGQVIEHSRLLDACAPDVVIRNGDGKAAATYFRRTRQKCGGIGRKWQPCTENGEIKPLPLWPDGFDSDQVFLPATVVKLPTQVIR